MPPRRLALAALLALPALPGCVNLAPQVTIADRHTVLEEDASGDWPELEQRLTEPLMGMGPVPLAADPEASRRRERAFNVLNGAFLHPTADEGS